MSEDAEVSNCCTLGLGGARHITGVLLVDLT